MILLSDKHIPIMKKVLIPIQFFRRLPVDIIGQNNIIDYLFTGLLCSGRILIEGVPGLAKTLLIKTLSDSMDLSFNRIQFTPDLMPSDITGTETFSQYNGFFDHCFRTFT